MNKPVVSRKHQCLVVVLSVVVIQGCGDATTVAPAGSQLFSDVENSVDGEGSAQGAGDDVIGPEGDSHLKVNELRYSLTSALGYIWGVEADHYKVNFIVSDGKYTRVVENNQEYDNMLEPVQASVVFYTEMLSPGDRLSFVAHSYSPTEPHDGELAGNPYFTNAYVGLDTNRSGEIESDEKMAVVGGTVEFIGLLPDIEMHFSVTLDDGQLVEGHYMGLFDFTSRE